ncbi:8545_t:CDS:10, partial [Diversispora eburnea]
HRLTTKMHEAFKVSVALDKLQHKIESIFAYGQKLFIGTNTGVLLIYEVNEPSDDEPITVTLIETHKNFSKKPIDQLDIIKEIGVLISLSEQLPKTRGANLFAIDTHIEINENKIPMIITRLAVAVKKKLLVFTWKDTEFKDTKELLPPDKVRTMAWVSSSKICLGLANEYALMDVNTGALTELFAPSSTPSSTSFSYMGMIGAKVSKPMVTKLPNDEILLAKDTGIDWTGTPEEIGYSYPYLIAILPKHVEVRNIMTQSLVQTVELPQARIINQGKYLYVASYSSVWRFTPLNFEKQIDQLIEKLQFEEAISLAEQIEPILLDDKEAKIFEIRRLYAHHLFQQQKFDEAITIFQELETEPAEVVALYPTSISGDLHADANYHHDTNKNSDVKTTEEKSAQILGNVVEEHENGYSATDSSATDSASEADVGLKQNENGVKETETEQKIFLEGKLLEDAVSALIRFLTDRRQKISKILKSSNHINGNFNKLLEFAELVDTTLLKSYMVINESLVGPLLRVPNHCNVEESEGLLLDRKKYRELVDLYKGKGLHRPMTGTIHTILYLQKLGMDHFDLILEYATWVLETNPEDGMDIFIEDHLEVENLPRDKVLGYLERFSYDLCIIYLEHIIYELGDQTPNYHNLLITTYLNKVQQLTSRDQQSHSELIDATNKKLLKFLDESTHYKAEKILGQLPLD